jgi:NTP pyrophosphatase (non-canonical NTP hydrolase)
MDTLKIWKELEKSGFFAKMREKLQKRNEKNVDPACLENITYESLLFHLYGEINELKKAVLEGDGVESELADVANLCGLLFIKIKEGN